MKRMKLIGIIAVLAVIVFAACDLGGSVISVTGVSLNKTATSIAAGSTETLFVAVTPANATNRNVTLGSSNPSVATVTQGGVVTGVAAGTATITVTTVDGGRMASCVVTVTAQTYTVTFNANGGSGTPPVSQTVAAGNTVTLPTATALSRSGYVFAGWNTNAQGTGTNYAAGASYTVTGNITLYARWTVTSQSSVEMVWVPAGSFELGRSLGTGGYSDTTPVSTVTLTGFYMGKYQVTQEQWQTVMTGNSNGISATPSYFSSSPATGEVQGRRPVERVSWYNILVFCNRLSISEGLTPAYSINGSTNPNTWGTVPTSSNATWNAVTIVSGSTGYRLPTEAQWEYAAKGGNGSPGSYTYSGSNSIDTVAWYSGNSSSRTHEVGKKAPNGLGLYDMSGNVLEWCWDWYGDYTSTAKTNPTGATAGANRVLRGGCWNVVASITRSSDRYGDDPSSRDSGDGFRLLRP